VRAVTRYVRCPFTGCRWPGWLRCFPVLTYSPALALAALTLRQCPRCQRVALTEHFR